MEIILRNIDKMFTRESMLVRIFENFNLKFENGSINCILGSSGCGKTTLLNMIAGFDKPDQGEICFNTTGNYSIGILFQNNVLFPWKTVRENIQFACQSKPECTIEVIREYLKRAGLEKVENCYPSELSGGMQQRIALIRILITKPEIVILDEAFGALDLVTRSQMQELFLEIHKETKFTAIIVTHDVMEAFKLGDNVYMFYDSPIKYEHFRNVEKSGKYDSDFFDRVKRVYNKWIGELS